jgi:hypothetical protein
MKRFNSTKPKFNHLFQFATLFIDFLHRDRRVITYEMIVKHLVNLAHHIWVKDL